MIQINGKAFGVPLLELAENIDDNHIIVRPWHAHENLEIQYVLAGVVTYRLKESRTDMTTRGGNFIIIAPGCKHNAINDLAIPSYRLTMRWQQSQVSRPHRLSPFSPAETNAMMKTLVKHAGTIIPITPRLNASAMRMLKLIATKQDPIDCRMTAWSTLFESVRACETINSASSGSGIVRKCIDHMKNHCGEKISIDELAEKSGCSRRTLFLSFQKETGVSPWKYLTRLRIDKAKQMLGEANRKSLMQIAMDCGFASSSHFTSVFSRYVGRRPSIFQTTTIPKTQAV